MGATQISMARSLRCHLEVTERCGMGARTERILLERTMVVVEGVARAMHPQINIWEVATPVVESYIRDNVGPRAAVKDLAQTALVLARFGPKLPKIVDSILTKQSAERVELRPHTKWHPLLLGLLIALLISNGVLLAINLL